MYIWDNGLSTLANFFPSFIHGSLVERLAFGDSDELLKNLTLIYSIVLSDYATENIVKKVTLGESGREAERVGGRKRRH